MTQALERPSFLKDAEVYKHDFEQMSKTRIRFRVRIKNATKSNSPKWSQVLQTSDLVGAKKSEVNLRGIKVFKSLEEAASKIRQALKSLSDWCVADKGDLVCNIDMAPLVWSQLLDLRDNLAPSLREKLRQEYESGLADYEARIEEFLNLQTWSLEEKKREEVKTDLLQAFPTLDDVEEFLVIEIGRPVIIPSIKDQLSEEQAECLQQIESFIKNYDETFQQRLIEAATQGAEEIASTLLKELSEWEPGRKPKLFENKLKKHMQSIQVLLSNASPKASENIQGLMKSLEEAMVTAEQGTEKGADKSHLQQTMNAIKVKLLNDQAALKEMISTDGMGIGKQTAMNIDWD